MKIVDSFLFSEPYEKELLLLKCILEDKMIDEWILLENSYSFQGDHIGLNAEKLINDDPRFEKYKHKLTIIAREEKTKFLPKHVFLDEDSYKVEYWQRDLAHDYFMKKYDDEDWIIISDVDEMIDFSNEERKQELLERMSTSNGLLNFPTRRYWYDFDNAYQQLIGNSMCTKRYLAATGKYLHEVRVENRKVLKKGWKNIIAFEYSSCYEEKFVLRKFYTFGHTGFTPNDLKQALRCNQRPTRELATWKAENNKYWFFETVKLDQRNSPKYVRENLPYYKTGLIHKNYKQNRKTDYPELFTMSYYVNQFTATVKKWLNKKYKAVKYKLKSTLLLAKQ
jgi:hypothetical protein